MVRVHGGGGLHRHRRSPFLEMSRKCFSQKSKHIGLLSKLHLLAKIVLFDISTTVFFGHVLAHCSQKTFADLHKNNRFSQAKRVLKEVLFKIRG